MASRHTAARPLGMHATTPTAAAAASRRIAWLDAGKGIALLAVVLGHSIYGLGYAKSLIFAFHMPLFFVYAGYTARPKPLRSVVASSARRLLVPYLALYAIDVILQVARAEALTRSLARDLLLRPLFASAIRVEAWNVGAVGMIWFFVALFEARLLFGAALLVEDRHHLPEADWFALWAALCAVGLATSAHGPAPLALDLVPLACLFMYAGSLARRRELLPLLMRPPVVAACALLWVASARLTFFSMGDRMFARAYLSIPAALAATVVVTWCAQLVQHIPALPRSLCFVGMNSLLMLAAHYLEAHFVAWASMPLIDPWTEHGLALFALRMVIIAGITVVASAAPISHPTPLGERP